MTRSSGFILFLRASSSALYFLIFQSDVLEFLIEAGHLKDVAHCRSSQNADTLAVLTDRDAVADQRDLAFCHMVVEGHDGPHFGLTRLRERCSAVYWG